MAPTSPDQIRHVSDTALMVAACRALETARPDGLVRDPFAAKLAGPRGDTSLHGITGCQLMSFGVGASLISAPVMTRPPALYLGPCT
jgi:O-methyltransferase involved in polyketide biosynthesis